MLPKLPNEVWRHIIRFMDDMESTCTLATIDSFLYKVVGLDFKRYCYRNVIYRLKSETWGYAFQHAPFRHHSTFADANCCLYTGRIVIYLDEHLLISNINFGLKEFKLLDFRKYIEGNPNDLEATGLIREAKLVNRGTRVIVAMNGATVVYDIEEDKISAEYDYNWKCNDMFCVYRDNVYVDLHNDKQFVLDGNVIEEKVQDLCLKDFRRYNIYQTKVGQLVLNDYLSNESNTVDVVDLSLALISRNTNMIYLFCRGSFHIYSIKEKKLVFSHTDYKHRYWNLFSDYALFNFETVELLHFNQKRKVWVKESHSLLTLLKNSSLTIQPSHSRDFILKLCRDTDRDHIVFNDWSKEKLNFKYFSSYPTEKRHHSLFDIELEKTCCEESRNDKNVDPQVLNKFNAIVEEYETEQKHINQIRSDKKITFTDLFNISK